MPVNLVHVILAPLSTSVKPVSIHLDEGIGIHVSNGFIALLLIYLVCF